MTASVSKLPIVQHILIDISLIPTTFGCYLFSLRLIATINSGNGDVFIRITGRSTPFRPCSGIRIRSDVSIMNDRVQWHDVPERGVWNGFEKKHWVGCNIFRTWLMILKLGVKGLICELCKMIWRNFACKSRRKSSGKLKENSRKIPTWLRNFSLIQNLCQTSVAPSEWVRKKK